eukprot:TRINITY_DN30794_c0_g1_i1.p1 TRINITY_DN30794_c0_g1~~TRINITY_DN30794_c0_g1_i1.p1  ORF type:complete len:208 (+),score=5.44 TRINITY_DN30794_c0_g1_i1:265-888(+)
MFTEQRKVLKATGNSCSKQCSIPSRRSRHPTNFFGVLSFLQESGDLDGYVFENNLCISCGSSYLAYLPELEVFYGVFAQQCSFIGNTTLDGQLVGSWAVSDTNFGVTVYVAWDTSALMGVDLWDAYWLNINATLRFTNVKVGPVDPSWYAVPSPDCIDPPTFDTQKYCDLLSANNKEKPTSRIGGYFSRVADKVLGRRPVYPQELGQ